MNALLLLAAGVGRKRGFFDVSICLIELSRPWTGAGHTAVIWPR